MVYTLYSIFRVLYIRMIEEVESNSKQYSLLCFPYGDLNQQKCLTHSTLNNTSTDSNEGRSLIEIANISRLKVNTIEDHIS